MNNIRCTCVASMSVMYVLAIAAVSDAQCVTADDTLWAYGQSTAVFVGTVVANRPTGEVGHHVTSDVATIRVERVWKGRMQKEVDVLADEPFVVGKRYVVFASGEPLSTSILCKWSEPHASARNKRSFLSGRPARPPG